MSKPNPNPASSKSAPDLAALSFEQAMEQLEAIVERVESGQVGLEQALAEYERGVALVRQCRDVLQKAELRVEELSKLAAAVDSKADGEA
ncbi:MAG: exodeoxyribonuclease VII small subunit [Planctomycetota bacterium]